MMTRRNGHQISINEDKLLVRHAGIGWIRIIDTSYLFAAERHAVLIGGRVGGHCGNMAAYFVDTGPDQIADKGGYGIDASAAGSGIGIFRGFIQDHRRRHYRRWTAN